MQIWVDADACPSVIKEILFRAAERTGVRMTLVANKPIRLPVPIGTLRFLQVPPGLDAADKRIVELMERDDLVVTADVPLAAAAIDRGGIALNPRGELYTKENVRERLSVRNFLDELRSGGVNTGGPPALSHRERQMFDSRLDTWLAKRGKIVGSL